MRTAPSPPSPQGPAATSTTEVLDLSVVIVNYNVREFLEQALRSVVRAAAALRVEVFVVDNNSVDGSVEMVRAQFPDVHVIANEANVGFSTANNQAIRQARGRYLLILNPDTILQEDTLSVLVRFMEVHPEAGAVGCKILNPDGTFALESRRAFPTPEVAFYRMVGLSRLFPRSRRFGRYNLTYLPADAVCEVDALSGSCMLVRRAALFRNAAGRAHEAAGRAHKAAGNGAAPGAGPSGLPEASLAAAGHEGAGLLDESYFMYGEDLDWCYRIQQAGWKIYYTPETQIVHYKGESTKKGELRYVRLFYGAMLQFAQKHFQHRHSRLFAWLLRGGIVLRAAFTVLSSGLRRLRAPLLDFAIVYGVVALLGVIRSEQTHIDFSYLFYSLTAPLYAGGTVGGVALAGGYRRSRHHHLRPVLLGVTLGLLVVAAASFFAKGLAFSRFVVGMAWPVSACGLALWRLRLRARRSGPRRCLLVGHAAEARRLQAMLARTPKAPFELVGYVAEADDCDPASTPPCVGTLRHLRDLVRLRRIDDVVFAADGLPNHVVFTHIQQLRDLPVQFKILAEGREHVIGKAAIHDLSLPALLEAEEALGADRPAAARRALAWAVALAGLLMHPFVQAAALAAGPVSFPARLAARTRLLPGVLAGRRALVGYAPDGPFLPPPEWGLKPGVFTLAETITAPLQPADARQVYWQYVRNASAELDWALLVRAVAALRQP